MKNFYAGILLFSIFFLLVISCSKDPNSSSTGGSTKPSILLSNNMVKIGQPLYATTNSNAQLSAIAWTASSNGQVWTSTSTDSATFLFTSPGTYTVSALFSTGPMNTADSAIATIVVSDSIYTDTVTMHCDVIVDKTIAPDDQISLTPVSYSDTGLIFVAHTKDTYVQSPILDCGGNGNIYPSGGSFECDFASAFIFACVGSPSPVPAFGIVSFSGVSNGTYNLAFKLNGTLYQGSFTATDTGITITWNYTSGVTISPLTIPKQSFH